VALPLDTSKALRTPAELRRLVECIRDAPVSEQETGWLEWKSHLDLVDRSVRAAVRATLAKGILGFTNREPSEARRSMEGVAYFVVGVEPQKLTGVELVDSADLEAQLEPYVGVDPRWTPTYVTLDDAHVLVVTVEAPVPGDPPYPARKTFQPQSGGSGFDDGTLFIRRGAKTGRATSSEIAMLVRRVHVAPEGRTLNLVVAPDGRTTAVERFAHSEAAVADFVRSRTAELLARVPAPSPPGGTALDIWSPKMAFLTSGGLKGEPRSPEEFRTQVANYAAELTAHVTATLPARALDHGIGEFRFSVSNPTTDAYTGVEVSVEFASRDVVGVYGFQGDLALEDEPEPPRDFGTPRSLFPLGGRLWLGPPRHVRPLKRPRVDAHDGHITVTYPEVDVRPEGTVHLRPIWVLLDEASPSPVTVRWNAAALDASHRLSGELHLPVSEALRSVEELMAKTPRG
jgi:hypothetical protein